MAELRVIEANKEAIRKGGQEGKLLPFAPGFESERQSFFVNRAALTTKAVSFTPHLINLWEESVKLSKESKTLAGESR